MALTRSNSKEAVYAYKFFLDNRITRGVLATLTRYCEKDGDDRLKIALELFVGVRKDACSSCRVASFIINPFLTAASRSFGSNKEELRANLKSPYWRSALLSVIKGISWFGAVKPHVPGAPFQIVWNVTRACNLKCKHCYASAGTIDYDELSTEDSLRAIDILSDIGVSIIAFSGGEPTVRPDILDLMNHADKKGIYVAAATNAMVLSSREKVREFKKNGLGLVQISLDGANPSSHDSFRGVKGAFNKTIEGIKNCVAEDLFVVIATTITKFNYRETPAIIELAEKTGANWFMMYNFVPTGRGKEMINADLSPEEREEILKILWHSMKTKKINILSTAPQYAKIAQEYESGTQLSDNNLDSASNYEYVMPTHFYNAPLPGELGKLADFIGGCGCGRFYLSMEPNGDIYPCVFFPTTEEVKLGNILNIDFENIWRNSKLLSDLRNKDILKGACGSCTYRYTCGGCRARAYNYFGDVLAPDPGCTMNKEYWLGLQNGQYPQDNIMHKFTEVHRTEITAH